MPDIIRSSIYKVKEGKDFRVVFKMPYLEFSVLSKNFTFIKVLTRAELQEYLDAGFLSWDEMLLKHCLSYRKFNELLKLKISSSSFAPAKPLMPKESHNDNYIDIFHLREMPQTGEVSFKRYKGAEEYRRHQLTGSTLNDHHELSGYIETNEGKQGIIAL